MKSYISFCIIAITSTITATRSSISTTTSITSVAKCGIQEIAPSPTLPRIYLGTEAVPNSWPWIVLLELELDCGDRLKTCRDYVCGGTLIHPQYVLTAAHCIDGFNASLVRIIGGLHDKISTTEDNIRQFRTVGTVYIHPTWNRWELVDDIAILKLSIPVDLTKYVQLACLPGAQPKDNHTVIIAGWGSTVLNGDGSNKLKQAFAQVVENCDEWWEPYVNNTKQICVANNVMGDSACSGDSGGPILAKNGNQWVVSGVASFVGTCMTNNSAPNVYTRVAYYLPWINSIIQ